MPLEFPKAPLVIPDLDKSTNARYDSFVMEYLTNGFNAREAAIAAKYSPSSVSSLLANKHIAKKLEWEFQRRRENYLVTEERILEELAALAFLDIGDLYADDGTLKPLSDMSEKARRAVGGIKVKEIFDSDGGIIGLNKEVKTESKIKALELLGKYKKFKMFTDVKEHTAGGDLALLLQEARKRLKAPELPGLPESTDAGENAAALDLFGEDLEAVDCEFTVDESDLEFLT